MKLAILGALPRELSYIIKNLGALKSPDEWPFPVYMSGECQIETAIVQTGMGMARATAALKMVLSRFKPDCILSTGFAGALYQIASPGDLVRGTRFFLFPTAGELGSSSACFMQSELKPDQQLPGRLAERLYGMTSLREGSIITLQQPLKKSILRKGVPEELPFPVCDMETFGLAGLSLESNIPFISVRSVSDVLDEEVPPELIGVVGETGAPNLGRLFSAITTNPALVTDVLRLRRNSEAASRNLGLFAEHFCRELS